MAQLIVRNLEEKLVKRLRERAARSGRSAEEEHREILRGVLLPTRTKSFKDALLEMPDAGDDALFERPRDLGRKVSL